VAVSSKPCTEFTSPLAREKAGTSNTAITTAAFLHNPVTLAPRRLPVPHICKNSSQRVTVTFSVWDTIHLLSHRFNKAEIAVFVLSSFLVYQYLCWPEQFVTLEVPLLLKFDHDVVGELGSSGHPDGLAAPGIKILSPGFYSFTL
jgi:hypothetical protein